MERQELLATYARAVLQGPAGLLSRGDLARIDDHVADAVAVAPVLEAAAVRSLVDVGSGAGLPGVPLAACLPEATVHLVESLQWKASFLREVVGGLGLGDRVHVHCLRAEEAVGAIGRESIDAGIARAVAAPVVVAEYLSPLVAIGGAVHAMTTRERAGSEAPSAAALSALGLGEGEVLPAQSPLRDDGVLLRWSKDAPCEARFPRRTGVAAKRPLDG